MAYLIAQRHLFLIVTLCVNEDLNTRITLLHRLRDHDDDKSWSEFVEIYTPLLFAYCRKREIKLQEITDIVQEVFRSVSLAMGRFQYDPDKGRFRAWLFTVLRNTIVTYFNKANRAPITSRETQLVNRMESHLQEETTDWDHDYRLRLLNWAMKKIQPEFSERNWTIFTETALHERSVDDVAAKFGMKNNTVTVTKYRITQRLRQVIQSVDPERWEQEMAASEKRMSSAPA